MWTASRVEFAMQSTSLRGETWTTRQNLRRHLSAGRGGTKYPGCSPRETRGGKRVPSLEYRVCCCCLLTKPRKSYNTPTDSFKAHALVCSSKYTISKNVIFKAHFENGWLFVKMAIEIFFVLKWIFFQSNSFTLSSPFCSVKSKIR